MRKLKLSDITSLITDGTHYSPPDIGSGRPFLTVRNIDSGGNLNLDDCSRISEEEFIKAKEGNSVPQVGDVLFSKDGTVGKVHIVNGKSEEFGVLSSLAIIRPIPSKIDSKYLGSVLKTDYCLNQASKKKTGSALRRIILKDLKNIEIPLPSLSEQKSIVAKLDRAQRLIDIDREMLAKYDELIQSVFLEMFGEVFTDNTETPFAEYLEINHGYAFKSKWFDDEGDVPVIKIGTVNKSTVDFSEVQFLDFSYAEEYERFKVYPGDLLLSMTGTVGKDDYANPCIMTDKYDFYLLNQRVVKLNYDKNVFTMSFLYHFFKQDHVKRELTKFSRGIRQANLSNKDIYGLSFQMPDLEKQLQFESLCEKVEQEKRSLKKSTKKSEELFSSLVQGGVG